MEWITSLGIIVGIVIGIIAFPDYIIGYLKHYKNWKKRKTESKLKNFYQENHPNYDFRIGYISNSPIGVCKLTLTFLNKSNEVKFIDMPSYECELANNEDFYLPGWMVMSGEEWPKRLEHGERFHININFESFLNNSIFNYWQKGVYVYAKCQSSTGDLLRSNKIHFDELVKRLEPLNEDFKVLAKKLSINSGESLRDFEASLWQLQIFKRLTVHIAKQLQYNRIPIAGYLKNEHDITLQENKWHLIDRVLNEKNIPQNKIVDFLNLLLS